MKRAPGLRSLSSDHHTALVLARRLLLAVSAKEVADGWQELTKRFHKELEPHFHLEEEQLLPALARAGETEIVKRTLAEHLQLRGLIDDGPCDAETLRAFAKLLQAHIRFEERELFTIPKSVSRSSPSPTPSDSRLGIGHVSCVWHQ